MTDSHTDCHTDDQSHVRICMCDRFPRGICRIIDSYIYDSHLGAIAELRGWRSRLLRVNEFDEPTEICEPSARDFKGILPSAHVIGSCCLRYEDETPVFAHGAKLEPLADAVIFEYVDRGVKDWDAFGRFFTREFPSARALVLEQNYTKNYEALSATVDAVRFIDFVKATQLRLFILVDLQSWFLDEIMPWEIFQAQPDDSHYVILTQNCNYLHKKLGSKPYLFTDKKRNATLQICVTGHCMFEPPAGDSV